MSKLSDTQCVLLSSASQRANGSILPLPNTLSGNGGTTKAVNALLTRGYAEERETGDGGAVHRIDGDVRWGLFITAAGAAAIGIGNDSNCDAGDVSESARVAPVAKGLTKATMVLALLERPEGATVPELIEATGWLPHTTRAALTGIRKKGHVIERGKRGNVTCYRVIR